MMVAADQTGSEMGKHSDAFLDGSTFPEAGMRSIPHGILLTRLERGEMSRRPSLDQGAHWESEEPERGEDGPSARRVPGWVERLLRIPLPAKLVGANVLLLVVAATTALILRQRELSTGPVLTVVIVAYLVALLLNTALVMLAVRPLRVLEKTVDTIWHGDLEARVPKSLLADRHVTRVARMFNILLEGLVTDRARTRRLATEIIDAGDRERAAISRELHDSAAQSLAALSMQLAVAVRGIDEAPPDVLRQRIEAARSLANSTLEEVRMLAHTMHPRVLDDLGLTAALERLARETNDRAASYVATAGGPPLVVHVTATHGSDEGLSAPVKSVLYRVAQEAVQNARKHAAPTRIGIRLERDAQSVTLEVTDDGRGFNPVAEHQKRTGIGLFTMRERVVLVDGELRITSTPGNGASVVASIPVQVPSSTTPRGAHP